MYKLSQEALSGKYQPLLAFAGIGVSILTGVSPLRHGIWTEFWHDQGRSPLKWTAKASMVNLFIDVATAKMGSTGHLAKSGITHFTFKVSNYICRRTYVPIALGIPQRRLHFFDTTLPLDPFHERTLPLPSIIDILRQHGISFRILSESKMRDSKIFAEAKHVDRNARLVFIQLAELDTIGHAVGPYSRRIHQSLRRIDSMVQEIVEKYREFLDTDVFIFSDHGMVEVRKVVDPLSHLRKAGLKEGEDYLAFLDSTLARFWTSNPDTAERILVVLGRLEGGRILSAQDLHQYQIPDDKRYGEIIWLADPGTLILPNYYQGQVRAWGMHGYAPEVKGTHSPFIIRGMDINPKKVKHLATPMDIFSTLLDLLHLPIPHYAEGQSLLAMP